MNIFESIPERSENEVLEVLHSSGNVRIERILSDHHTTGWYCQDEDEWVCLLEGEADIEFEDHVKTLHRGDYILIPRCVRHRVSRTTKCVWLCVFMGGNRETD